MVDIERNYIEICQRIALAAQRNGRDPDSIRLIVVTKGQPIQAVEQVIAAGARCLGENYVEEALPKIQALTGKEIEWRMIGHVQSRKAREIVQNFSGCDALDSLQLAVRLDRFAGLAGRRLPVLLEFNVSGETSKFGFAALNRDSWPDLVPELAQVAQLPNLQVQGLMTMPPFFDDPQLARPYFQCLRELRNYLSEHLPLVNWGELSMGMSGDFETAIQEGATVVRIGTAIMGPRS
ncbi:MAG: hypothetical protein H6Q37_1199 [Chloroflexi bacterium]|jgi:hypothetical protein|nr:hypothetical protein [Chloroflexota bacterium]